MSGTTSSQRPAGMCLGLRASRRVRQSRLRGHVRAALRRDAGPGDDARAAGRGVRAARRGPRRRPPAGALDRDRDRAVASDGDAPPRLREWLSLRRLVPPPAPQRPARGPAGTDPRRRPAGSGSAHRHGDPVVAAGAVGRRVADVGGLDAARAVGRPDLDRVRAVRGVPGQQPLDPGRLGDRLADWVGCQARRRPDLDPVDAAVRAPRRRRPGRPGPAAGSRRRAGTSIRDWVRIGPSLAQPSGIQ